MSVTGEFLADFLDFIRGAKSAEDALDKLESKGKETADGWEKAFAKGGNLEKFFDAPLKTSTGLVKDFVMEMGPMGAVALAGAAGVAAAGTALIAMGNATANTADYLGDMADKTGMTVPELSKLSNAATLAGTSLGALTDLSFTMQTRMEKNPEEFARGLKTLSINAKEFADAGPEQKVELFTRALAANGDVVARNQAGLDMAGKSYKEMSPALLDLGAGALDAADGLGHVFTAQDAANAEHYHEQLNLIKIKVKGVADDIGAYLVPALGWAAEKMNAFWDQAVAPHWDSTKRDFENIGTLLEAAGLKAEGALPEIKDVFKASVDAAQASQQAAAAADLRVAAAVRQKEVLKEQAELEREQKKAEDDLIKTQLEWADAMFEVITAGEGWRETVKGINPETAAFAAHLIEMGVSQKNVAIATGLTTYELKALGEQAKDTADLIAEAAAREKTVTEGLQTLWSGYYDAVAAGSADTTQKRIDDIWRQMNAESLALDNELKGNQEAMDLIVAKAKAKTDAVIKNILAEDNQTRDYYERAAEEAAAGYAFALEHSDRYTASRIDDLREETEAANAALADWQYVAEAALTGVGNKAEATTAALKKTRDAAHDAFMPGEYSAPDTGLHQEMRFGQPVLVNQSGQVVQSNLQAQYGAGGFLGYSLPPGQTMQNVVNINGILMGNDPAARQQLADAVGRSLTDTLKGQGQRLGSGV
jgi:hypothetical protein